MNDFKKPNRFGSDNRGGGFSRGPSRPSYGNDRGGYGNDRRPSGGRDFNKPTETFTATCSNCNASCEVPFRPNGKKPVFCKNCFVRDATRPSDGVYEKRPFNEVRPAPGYKQAPAEADPRIGALQKELGAMHAKLDALIARIEGAAYSSVLASSKNAVAEEAPKKAAAKAPAKAAAPAKKVAKKAAKKKA